MTWRTLEEWNSKGRMVKKGEKSILREPETGLPLFSKGQTVKTKSREYECNDYERYTPYGKAKQYWLYTDYNYDDIDNAVYDDTCFSN